MNVCHWVVSVDLSLVNTCCFLLQGHKDTLTCERGTKHIIAMILSTSEPTTHTRYSSCQLWTDIQCPQSHKHKILKNKNLKIKIHIHSGLATMVKHAGSIDVSNVKPIAILIDARYLNVTVNEIWTTFCHSLLQKRCRCSFLEEKDGKW